ncbi:hypothetical protein WJX73_006067 [Symbiochloris irregularis]|uniref:AB hydrolase-1 domain-containing protein n=1 Tax=Symbiochloris irregularis TaxID=706552 RepID=A0AAW1NQ37_9CHLO
MHESEAPGQLQPRHSYFKYKVLDDPTLQSRLSTKGFWSRQQAACDGCSERMSRSLRLLGFLFSFALGLFRAMAPWCLAVLEVGTMILLWFLITPHSIRHFRYRRSLDDLVLLSCVRFVAVLLAYACGLGRQRQRPYWYTALTCAAVGYAYLGVKLLFLDISSFRPAPLAVICVFGAFCAAHVLIAGDVMKWASQRYEMGLSGAGYPWTAGEAEYRRRKQEQQSLSHQVHHKDLPARDLADADSRFLQCCGVEVHYKQAFPEVASASHSDISVILTHGFGAGVFAWRHIMQPLANKTGCRVLAFDRVGFGLTSRPDWNTNSTELNPYSNMQQSDIIHKLCEELNLDRVILCGHADGSVIALTAAANMVRQSEAAAMSGDDTAEAASSTGRSETLCNATAQGKRADMVRRGDTGDETRQPLLGVTIRHSRRSSAADIEGQAHVPQVVGLCLMHPCFAGEGRPQLARLLTHSRLGGRLLRGLLRSEVGVVAHRRAWADSSKLTPNVLSLYRRPLQVQGWDRALVEVGRASKPASPSETAQDCRSVSAVPTIVILGQKDRIASHASAVCKSLAHSRVSIIPTCGHMSHEEAPGVLVGTLAGFVGEALEGAEPPKV